MRKNELEIADFHVVKPRNSSLAHRLMTSNWLVPPDSLSIEAIDIPPMTKHDDLIYFIPRFRVLGGTVHKGNIPCTLIGLTE